MFEIPTNLAKDLRTEVVDLVCRAFYEKREMYYCDTCVKGDGTFWESIRDRGSRLMFWYLGAFIPSAFLLEDISRSYMPTALYIGGILDYKA